MCIFEEKITKDGTQFITNSLGYRREWQSKDLSEEIQKSLVILELDPDKQ